MISSLFYRVWGNNPPGQLDFFTWSSPQFSLSFSFSTLRSHLSRLSCKLFEVAPNARLHSSWSQIFYWWRISFDSPVRQKTADKGDAGPGLLFGFPTTDNKYLKMKRAQHVTAVNQSKAFILLGIVTSTCCVWSMINNSYYKNNNWGSRTVIFKLITCSFCTAEGKIDAAMDDLIFQRVRVAEACPVHPPLWSTAPAAVLLGWALTPPTTLDRGPLSLHVSQG